MSKKKDDRPEVGLRQKPDPSDDDEDKLDELHAAAPSIVKPGEGDGRDDEQEEKKRTTFYLPASLHRRLKAHAALQDESMSGVVTEAVRRLLEDTD